MRRWCFWIIFWCCAVIVPASGYMWNRSYTDHDMFHQATSPRMYSDPLNRFDLPKRERTVYEAWSFRGVIGFAVRVEQAPIDHASADWPRWMWGLNFLSAASNPATRVQLRDLRQGTYWGFALSVMPDYPLMVTLPYWFLILFGSGIVLRGIVSFTRLRVLRRPGFCTKCGYDLRATPDRCPECGQEAEVFENTAHINIGNQNL